MLQRWGHRCLFFEVKGPRGRLSPAQEKTIQELRDNGNFVFVVKTVDEALIWLKSVCDEWNLGDRVLDAMAAGAYKRKMKTEA